MADTPAEPSAPVAPEPTPDLFSQLDAPADTPVESEPVPETAAPPEAPTAPPSPSSVEPPKAEPPPEAAPERTIPLAVLLEERRKADEREAKLNAQLEELKAKAPEKPAEPDLPVPDFLDDPKGYVDAQLARANAAVKRLEESGTKRMTEVEARTAEQTVASAIAAASDQFAAKTPDFKDALGFARTTRAKQIEVLNPDMKPEQIANAVLTEEHNLATQLVRQGIDPAERIYRLAAAMGYTPPKSPTPTPPKAKADGRVPPDVTLNATPGQRPEEAQDEEPDLLSAAKSERFSKVARR